MNDNKRKTPWFTGMALGALVFGAVYLPAALADHPPKDCKAGEVFLCDKSGKSTCAKPKDVEKKQDKGYFIPTGGACPSDAVSET